jgi:hypothetical protein
MNLEPREAIQCQAITLTGTPCTNMAVPGFDFCHLHFHEQYLQRAVRRALVVSVVLLVMTVAAPYFFPELARLVSCTAILAATLAGLEIAVLKTRKTHYHDSNS